MRVGFIFAVAFLAKRALCHDEHSRVGDKFARREVGRALAEERTEQTVASVTGGVSIAQTIRGEYDSGNRNPRLTIHVKENGAASIEGISEEAEEADDFVLHTYLPVQAVTSLTVVGNTAVGDMDNIILVADTRREDPGTLAIIAVNLRTGEADGIVHKGGRKMKLSQGAGERVTIYEAKEFSRPAWKCYVGDIQRAGGDARLLAADHDHDDHGLPRRHEDHVHSHRHDAGEALMLERSSLRGSNDRLGDRRRLQGGEGYSHQVDLYIEVDQDLVDINGGSMSQTVDYVNTLVTGANTIYEPEIDTHLNVKFVNLTDRYDQFNNASESLIAMKAHFGGDTWHADVDLHHALLGRKLGGGIATPRVVCNSKDGFGITAQLLGTFESVDDATVWDLSAFAHELGHNLGSEHTHDPEEKGGYTPLIDTCGLQDSDKNFECPAELPQNKSATIMSYCNLCEGGSLNIAYTLGGVYQSGDRSSADSYIDTPGLGPYNVDPRRVNVKMYDHVSTRGACTAIVQNSTMAPTSTPTKSPSATPTKEPSAEPQASMSPTSLSKPSQSLSDSPSIVPSGSQKPTASGGDTKSRKTDGEETKSGKRNKSRKTDGKGTKSGKRNKSSKKGQGKSAKSIFV